jgi:hypothetical protein
MGGDKATSVLLFVSIGLVVFYSFARLLGSVLTLAAIWLFPVVSVVSVMLALTIVLNHSWAKKIRLVHWGLLLGFVFWFLGELTGAIATYIATPNFAGIELFDLLFLIGYASVIVVLTLFLWDFSLKYYFAIAMAALLVLDAFYAFIIVSANAPFLLTDIPNLTYPILDTFLVFLAIMMFMILRGDPLSRAWIVVAVGILLTGVGDALFIWGSWSGWYYVGHPMELPWLWGYLCMGVGIYMQRAGTVPTVTGTDVLRP